MGSPISIWLFHLPVSHEAAPVPIPFLVADSHASRACRVKCDEAKPVCGRCVRLGKHCSGYGVVMPARTTGTSSTSNSPASSDGTCALSRRKQRICIEAEPLDWDHMQAIQFCMYNPHH